MKTGLHQHPALRQDLRINPRLYQAMDLLYMPLIDLQQHLKQELLGNPFLELLEPEEEEEAPVADEAKAEKEKKEKEDDEPDWENILLDDGAEALAGSRDLSEAREYVEPVPVETKDLSDHLRDQVQMLDLTPRQRLLADEFLGNIAEDGYLTATLEEIIKGANQLLEEHAAESEVELTVQPYTLAEAEEMLKIVQVLDPPGVGARDLRECLLLQLEDQKRTDTLAYRLVKEVWEDLKAHRWSDIGKRYGLSPEEVQRAADDIAKLDPKPGLQYSAASDVYIIPDLVVQKVDDKYHVFLNDSGLPRLRISKTYQDIARDKKQYQGENKEFINQRLNSAHWMIQAIEQRRQTMLKVMNFIVDRQREFFEKGVEFLKPLTLREVAEVIGMHESTVSRVTNEKYVQTPRGLLPLKFFFSSGLSTTTGEDASARSIKAQIQKMVSEEDPKDPLTDQQIVELFARRGVKIARRTVAKYRDQLGVLPARMRKRL
ncbi:MAG: RNA polymerase sigma-54 factor [Gemmatimonadetes bacterium 13_1_40CM_70_11]|nr:MAG: RNA polymerase sigma-54 factor [Gemmatimonadetes bacterium 13_1_40CM_70_11]